MNVELFQFNLSPYNEKARWALDYKSVPHTRKSVMPGPHMLTIKRLSGQTKTPVLRIDGTVFCGSDRILAEIERRWPVPALMSHDPNERKAALTVQSDFDDDWTPRMRRAVLDAVLDDYSAMARTFGGGTAYRLMLPLAAPLVRKGNGITGPDAIADGHRAIEEALDFVAEKSSATGYLVGRHFGLADLCAASSLAMVVVTGHRDMTRPQPLPERVSEMQERWQGHPGAAWVKEMYARHRDAV